MDMQEDQALEVTEEPAPEAESPSPPEPEAASEPEVEEPVSPGIQKKQNPFDIPLETKAQKPAAGLPPIEMFPPEDPPEPPEETPAPPEPESQQPSKNRIYQILTAVLLLLVVAGGAVFSYIYFAIRPYGSYDKILPNVYCAGVDLGGMTRSEAEAAVEEALRSPSYQVKVLLPDAEYVFQPEQEGITLNGAAVAELAYAYGRSDPSAYGMYRAYHLAQGTEYRLNAETLLNYSTSDIQTLAEQIYQETYIAPMEASVSCDTASHTVTVDPGEPGRQILPEVVTSAVYTAFDTMDFSDIVLEYDPVEIDFDALRSLCRNSAYAFHVLPVDAEVSANQESHSIEVTLGQPGWKLDSGALYALAEASAKTDYAPVTVDMEPVEPLEFSIAPEYYELACEPTEPYYEAGEILEGSNGYTLDWDSAIAEILAADYGEHLSIAMTPIEPKHTAEEVRSVLFRDQLSSYSTAHTANASRTNNLDLACQSIDGTVINSGDIFSFNSIVGERTAARGFTTAIVYVSGASKEEVGGGICQVASTIYDAALYAEMEITERDCHQFFVTYVPGGLDATIYWGALDFCFRNTSEYPIRVNAWVSGGYVHISIDGTKVDDHVVELSSTCLETRPYGTVYQYDSSKPTGYQSETVSPYTGYTYEAYQYIYDGSGNLLETNYLGTSYYSKRDRVITVGTG